MATAWPAAWSISWKRPAFWPDCADRAQLRWCERTRMFKLFQRFGEYQDVFGPDGIALQLIRSRLDSREASAGSAVS
jgi:hypothetical protein